MIRSEGTDMSPYSHDGRKHVSKVKFTITGMSDGTYIHPEEKVAGMMVDSELKGLYHYLRSSYSCGAQVDTFLEAIFPWQYDFLAVDFEKIHNVHGGGTFGTKCQKFISDIKRETGKKVLLYTRATIIQEWLLPFGQTWYQDEDLWMAQYPYYGWNPVMREVPTIPAKWNPRLPAGAKTWKAWQYSADGNNKAEEYGGLGNPSIDLVVFNGTTPEMKAWATVESPVPVDPDPPIVIPTTEYNEAIDDSIAVVESLRR